MTRIEMRGSQNITAAAAILILDKSSSKTLNINKMQATKFETGCDSHDHSFHALSEPEPPEHRSLCRQLPRDGAQKQCIHSKVNCDLFERR